VGDLQPLALDLEHIDLHSEFNMLVRRARDELAQLRVLIKGTLLSLRWLYTLASTHVLCACNGTTLPAEDAVEHSMFGVPSRLVDFSQLVPRGHYTKVLLVARRACVVVCVHGHVAVVCSPMSCPCTFPP